MADFHLSAGDRLPILTDTLSQDGVPVSLLGADVTLSIQNLRTGVIQTFTATVVSAEGGRVKYQWGADDTTEHGPYIGNWTATFAGRSIKFPNDGSFSFHISVGADVAQPIASLRPYIRTLLGDTNPLIKQYSAEELDGAVRLVVNLGKAPGVALSADELSLAPAVSPSDSAQAKNWARIVYYAAKLFIMPNAASSGFRTRALAEHFGEQKEQVLELLLEIHEMENDGATLE